MQKKLGLRTAILVLSACLFGLLAAFACGHSTPDPADAAPSHKLGLSNPNPSGTGLYYGTNGVASTAALAPGTNLQVLCSDGGMWGACDPTSVAVEGQDYQFSNTVSDISTYFTLAQVATGSESDLTAAVTSGGGQVLVKQFSTPLGEPGVTLLPKGLYEIRAYEYASFTGAFTTDLAFKFYKRTSGGSESLLFTATGPNIQRTSVNSSPDLFTFNFSSDTALTPDGTDRLVVKVYGETSSVVGGTVHFVFDGATHASLVQTPITGGTLAVAGFITGNLGNTQLAANQSATFNALTSNTLNGAVGIPYADAGASTTLVMPARCATFNSGGTGPVTSCEFGFTTTDATTWAMLFPDGFLTTARTSGTYEIDYHISDQTDAADAGPVDVQFGNFKFTVTTSNGGNVNVLDDYGLTSSSSSLALVAAANHSYIGGAWGFVAPSCRVQVVGNYIQPQCQGRTGKTDNNHFVLQHLRGTP